MATTQVTVDCKLFQIMTYIIILKVRKFHQPTANRFITARQKPVGGKGTTGLKKLLVPNICHIEIMIYIRNLLLLTFGVEVLLRNIN